MDVIVVAFFLKDCTASFIWFSHPSRTDFTAVVFFLKNCIASFVCFPHKARMDVLMVAFFLKICIASFLCFPHSTRMSNAVAGSARSNVLHHGWAMSGSWVLSGHKGGIVPHGLQDLCTFWPLCLCLGGGNWASCQQVREIIWSWFWPGRHHWRYSITGRRAGWLVFMETSL